MLENFYYFLTKITHFEAYFVQYCSLYESGSYNSSTLASQNKQNNQKHLGDMSYSHSFYVTYGAGS